MARMAAPIPASSTLADVAELWRHSLRAGSKAPKTITTYLFAIDRLAAQVGRDRPIERITRRDHETLLGDLLEHGTNGRPWQPASVSTVYRSLRAFWHYVVDHDDLPVSHDPMNGMKAPEVREKVVPFLTDAELVRVLATCKGGRHNYLGHRDEAIIRILATTGARLSEVANIRMQGLSGYVEPPTGRWNLGPEPTVTVMGKGQRERELPLNGPALAALKVYLNRERPRHAAAGSDWLWLGRTAQFGPGGIEQALAMRGRKAGIKREIHPHELRHRFIDHVLSDGLSEGDTMAITGHR